MSETALRALLADDHAAVRRGIREILEDEFEGVVLGEVDTAEDVLDKVAAAEWDILILDLSMPGRSGLDTLVEIKRTHPDLPVLMMSMHAHDQFAMRCLQAGASGYLTKENAPTELAKAIRKVMAGDTYVGDGVARGDRGGRR